MATKLTDPWAAPPHVVCDFGWYQSGGILFPTETFVVNGVTYPPPDFTWVEHGVTYSSQYRNNTTVAVANGQITTTTTVNVRPPVAAALKQTIIFDAVDSLSLGIPKVYTPHGVTIVAYEWDLGNGATGVGPTASTIYNYTTVPPDLAVTLTVIDSLDHRYTTTHYLTLASLASIGGTESRQIQGTGRT